MLSTKPQFKYTVQEINNKSKSHCSHTDWLKMLDIPYCKLVVDNKSITKNVKYGFAFEEDRDLFFIEFLGDFKIEHGN